MIRGSLPFWEIFISDAYNGTKFSVPIIFAKYRGASTRYTSRMSLQVLPTEEGSSSSHTEQCLYRPYPSLPTPTTTTTITSTSNTQSSNVHFHPSFGNSIPNVIGNHSTRRERRMLPVPWRLKRNHDIWKGILTGGYLG